ncbi:MAG: FtsW/RodA/SpoVE family cell cycle protein [Rhodobacteraceae bacterium]|nr:FtsW/RodA/SpoVE family cell cycle protein [Paracoccaceae bacterium]
MTEIIHGSAYSRTWEPILSRWLRTVDRGLIVSVFVLYLLGLLLCFAATPHIADRMELDQFHFVYRQAAFGLIAIVVMLAISALSTDSARRVGVVVFGMAFIGLLLLPILGTDYGKGAVRWFSLPFGSLQPSEFLKPGFVIVAAWFIAGSKQAAGPPGKRLSLGLAVLLVMLLAMQPDFGQASLIIFGWSVLYFMSGAAVFPLVGIAAAVVAAGVLFYNTSEHFARRISNYVSGEIGSNSQLAIAMNAIQEGGFFGVGVGEGTVKRILPDAHTDFVVAVAAEEYGFGLVLILIGIYCFICMRAFLLSGRATDPFIRLAGNGLAAMFGVQAFIHIAVSAGLLPAKGLTLPFISYGGSSMISIAVGLGMLLAFTRNASADSEEEDRRGRSVFFDE